MLTHELLDLLVSIAFFVAVTEFWAKAPQARTVYLGSQFEAAVRSSESPGTWSHYIHS